MRIELRDYVRKCVESIGQRIGGVSAESEPGLEWAECGRGHQLATLRYAEAEGDAGAGAGAVTQVNLRARAQRQSCKRVPVVKPEKSQEEAENEKAVSVGPGLCET